MNPADADLIVVGGGVLGAFHAYHAVQRGLRVTLLERHAAPQGATVRNFGQVVPSGLDSRWQPWGRESLRIYQSLQQQADISVRKLGTVYIASDEDELGLLEELSIINHDADYASELWTPGQCQDRYPQLRSDYVRGGLFFPDELSVNPRTMIHRVHRLLAESSRCSINFCACVQTIESDPQGVGLTASDGRTFRAERAILCCGSEFKTLYPELFRSSGLEAVKLQMLRLQPLPGVSLPGNLLTGLSIRRYESFAECPSYSAVKSRESEDGFAKRWGVHILFKQEADGGVILGDSHEYAAVDEADSLGFELRSDINDCFLAEGKKILDLPAWDVEASWFGVYCQTKDPTGIYRRQVEPNVHVVTGIGGKGMTSSAGFSRQHLAEIYND